MRLLEECKQYRGMKVEAALLHQQLQELERSPVNEPSQREQLQRRIRELLQHCANVDAAIANAPNAILRAAMIMHYQQGLKWQDVASAFEGGMLEGAIRTRVNEYLTGR